MSSAFTYDFVLKVGPPNARGISAVLFTGTLIAFGKGVGFILALRGLCVLRPLSGKTVYVFWVPFNGVSAHNLSL